MKQHMTMRTYKATVRRAHELHVALDAAKRNVTGTYPQRDQINRALEPMQVAINALRPQVCRRCDEAGFDPKPRIPGWHDCRHPDVPIYDLRTGEEWKP